MRVSTLGASCAKVASLALAASALVVHPAAGEAASQRGCVTRAEFRAVKVGMRMNRVHEIFGTSGADTGLGSPNSMRYYSVCRPPGMVQVTYNPRDRVVSKSGNWFG